MRAKVGYEGLRMLKVGEEVEYKAGQGDWRVEAVATVTGEPGPTGVYVRLYVISVKGSKAEVVEGDEILAGANELYK